MGKSETCFHKMALLSHGNTIMLRSMGRNDETNYAMFCKESMQVEKFINIIRVEMYDNGVELVFM